MSVYACRRDDKRSSQAMDTIRKLTENYEQEKKSRESWEQRFEQMQLDHDRSNSLLERSNKNNEKLREENKVKVDQMEKMRRDMNYLEDRLRSLEHRATEVSNLEISVENLKKNLENSQQETKDAERDLRIARRALEENEKKLSETQRTIIDLQVKMSDLKLQVKEEVIRNSKLEEQLEKVSRIREELTERDDRITQLEKDIDEKTMLLQHCRKCLREEKEKANKMTSDSRSNDQLADDIQISQSENITLKKLLVAKDTMLVQKSQLLENIRNVAQNSPKSEEHVKIMRLLEGRQNGSTLTATYPQGAKGKDPQYQRNAWGTQPQKQHSQMNGHIHNQNHMNGHSEADQANNNTAQGQQHRQLRRTPPHSAPSSSHHQSELFRTLLETEQNHDGQSESSSISEIYMQGGERGRARTPFMRPQPSRMYRDSFEDFRSPSPYGSEDSNNSSVWARRSVTSPRNGATNGPRINASASPVTRSQSTKTHPGNAPYQPKSGRDRNSRWSSPGPRDSSGGSSPRSVRRTKSMTSHHATHKTSRPASQTSSVDRDKAVKRLVHVGDRVLVNMGKKPDGKMNMQGAIIKYLGSLDQEHSAISCYAGVKLDEPVGDTNGVHNGKQYFRVSMQHGKFIRMQKIAFLLDPATGMYKDLADLQTQSRR